MRNHRRRKYIAGEDPAMHDFEAAALIGYLLNLLKHSHQSTQTLAHVIQYLDNNYRLHEQGDEITTILEEWESSRHQDKTDRNRIRADKAAKFRGGLIDLLTRRKQKLDLASISPLENNVRLLAAHLEFEATDSAILGLILRHQTHGGFERFLNDLTDDVMPVPELCAALLGIEVSEFAERMRPGGHLLSTAAVSSTGSGGPHLDCLWIILDPIRYALQRSRGGLEELLANIIGEPCTASLSWGDFEHLDPIREKVIGFLRQAAGDKISGVNILLWGPPGTGKTEFCKTLATRIGMTLYAVGEADEEGNEPSSRERMSYYRLAQNLLRNQKETILLFDEMDDLFEGNSLARFFGAKLTVGSKVFMNRQLERNPVPTFWIVNNPELLDEAFIRRMSLAIQLKVPPANVRERVWKRVLEKNRVEMPDDEMRRMAELNIAPAVIDSAARFTRQVGGDSEDFRFAAQGIILAMRGGRPLQAPSATGDFLPDLTCADLDLNHLTQRLCLAPNRAFSFCLYGPPGTGKSAYLRYLADTLKMPVLMKRASDLLDKYVGESEKLIAEAFQESIDRQAFLIFDEADSLLGDRRFAVRSWEVSQVNEMLTWMERHPLPFACTTNLMDRLDTASLRRFTFKCRFDYLLPRQAELAFEHFFGHPLPQQGRAIQQLTPGDFAVVRRKAEVLGVLNKASELLELLREEVREKETDTTRRVVGFKVAGENQ